MTIDICAIKFNIHHVRQLEDVIRRISEEVDKRGWNQKKLALEMGVGEDWVSRRMTMKSKLTISGLISIANALGVEPASLLAEENGNPKRDEFREYCKTVVLEILEEEIEKKKIKGS